MARAIFCHQIGQSRASSHHTVKTKVAMTSALPKGRPRGFKSRPCEACEMVSTESIDALTVAKGSERAAKKETEKATVSRPSPAQKFDIERDEPAIRAGRLQVQAQRFRKLHAYYDEALAEIRASLER